MEVRLYFEVGEGLSVVDSAATVNVSLHGARILTARRCLPGERSLVASLSGEIRLQARVVYCHSIPGGRFCAVGLRFFERISDWKNFR